MNTLKYKALLVNIRCRLLVWLTHTVALPLLKTIRKPIRFRHTAEQLRSLPPGTLGNDLIRFLDERKLSFLPHYARHDLKHLLLNYDTTEEGELCLQSFMLGNGRISFPVLATVLFGLLTSPEHYIAMRDARKKGSLYEPFHDLPWQDLLEENTAVVKSYIFRHKN